MRERSSHPRFLRRTSGLSARSRAGCEEFAECRRDHSPSGAKAASGTGETFSDRKIRYPLCLSRRFVAPPREFPLVERRGGAERSGKRRRRDERAGKERRYDVWESKSNFRSFVNFVCPEEYKAKRIFQAGTKFFRYPRKLNRGGYTFDSFVRFDLSKHAPAALPLVIAMEKLIKVQQRPAPSPGRV